MKAFLTSTLKIALAIVLALVTSVAIVAGGYKLWDDREKERIRAEALLYEEVAFRQIDLRTQLNLNFTVETKVVDGFLYASVQGFGFPKYLEHPVNKNSGAFILKFSDGDGFKLYEKSIPVRDFTTIVTGKVPTGISYHFKELISIGEYKRISKASIGWTVDENLIPVVAQPSPPKPTAPPTTASKPIVTLPDPCAPGISKEERLRRLEKFGVLKQTGPDSYAAGNRAVVFYANSLMSCS